MMLSEQAKQELESRPSIINHWSSATTNAEVKIEENDTSYDSGVASPTDASRNVLFIAKSGRL